MPLVIHPRDRRGRRRGSGGGAGAFNVITLEHAEAIVAGAEAGRGAR